MALWCRLFFFSHLLQQQLHLMNDKSLSNWNTSFFSHLFENKHFDENSIQRHIKNMWILWFCCCDFIIIERLSTMWNGLCIRLVSLVEHWTCCLSLRCAVWDVIMENQSIRFSIKNIIMWKSEACRHSILKIWIENPVKIYWIKRRYKVARMQMHTENNLFIENHAKWFSAASLKSE